MNMRLGRTGGDRHLNRHSNIRERLIPGRERREGGRKEGREGGRKEGRRVNLVNGRK